MFSLKNGRSWQKQDFSWVFAIIRLERPNSFWQKIDADRHLFAHKVHDEKPTMVRLDVQTSCLRGINMVFVIHKHGVYEK